MLKKIALIALVTITGLSVHAQIETKETILKRTATLHKETEIKDFQRAVSLAKQNGWELSYHSKDNNIAFLVGVDRFGYPIYYTTQNNIIAAATTRANVLWPGGSSGLNLSGSQLNMKDKMAVWDGGRVLSSHVELTGRVLQKDLVMPSLSDHSTHVAGTMIASGANPIAKGMAFGLQRLIAYDFSSDASEMASEASGLLLSNHSYGTIAGWRYNDGASRWEFWGRASDSEDYKFGYYDDRAQLYDSIAYNAPYYLIVKSSGNNRNENGPAVGQNYWRLNSSGQMTNAGTRPSGISSNDGYDIISTYGTAKNILTVGAVRGIEFGYTKKEDVLMSSFSSWGPTDDGRIKPDIVADGVDVVSSVASSNSSYANFSGTSMASPNTTGSLLLLQEYYSQLHAGSFMRSATLKGIAIHTADEAGFTPGPDYQNGWGLLNVGKAAEVIRSNNTGSHLIHENVMNDGTSYSLNVVASGNGMLSATISWTDIKGDVETVNVMNNSTKKLVNDLDIRITKGTTTYQPWILTPSNPAGAALKGDNELDNVERINIEDAVPGQTYTITVTHKGVLARGSQAYSLIVSGVGGQAYCTSTALSTAGSRIDSVGFGSIQKLNAAGCTSYTDYTNLSTSVEPGQTLPVSVRVNSCDATNNPKIVKVFIDYNNNGIFTDAGEVAATSGVLNNGDVFSGNITIPSNVTIGNATIMRVVTTETSVAGDVAACSNYNNGETQDYILKFIAPSNDLAVIDLIAPSSASCGNSAQYVTVRLRNTGIVNKSNVPLTVVVKDGASTVATLNAVNASVILPSGVSTYTFQTPFTSVGGTTYQFEIFSGDATDQNRSNDTLRTNVTISATPSTPTAEGVVCGTNSILKVTNPAGSNYFWYTSPTSDQSIASGATAITVNIPANNTYYVASGAQGNVGLASKAAFPGGGGYLSGSANFMKYTASVPVILESARLYTKYPGKIDFIVANITSQTPTGYNYQIISTTTLDVHATSPNQAPGTQNVYDVDDNGAVFNLNLFLPSGDHAIIIRPQGDANIFRNNNVTGNPYPFELPNVISFYNNSATSASDPNFFQGFYYSLYNMKVRTTDCVSERATVVATVAPTPVITQVADSLVSSIDNGNQWYRDGVGISGATGKKYKPITGGNYTVVVTDPLGCQRSSASFPVTFTAVNPVDNANASLVISPNPSNGNFVLRFKATRRDDMVIELVNAQGQSVYSKTHRQFAGELNEQMQLKNLSSGIYVLKLMHAGKVYYNKIIIER